MIRLKGELDLDLTKIGLRVGDEIKSHTPPASNGAVYFDIRYNGVKQECVVWNENYELVDPIKRGTGMSFFLSQNGICSICGCTEKKACVDVDYGACWWTDDEETLCSHCASLSNPNSLHRLIEEEEIDEL